MESANQALALAVAILCGAFVSGCSSGAHTTASGTTYVASRTLYAGTGPVYLAQSATACTQFDSTMTCCIKKNPANAAQACGAAAWEIAEVLATLKGVDVPEREEDDDGKEMPGWRQYCRDTYNQCIDDDWHGTWTCHDCFRYCEGQRGGWPQDKCYDPGQTKPSRKK
ncbi:hypothetical protein P2318_27790 [Myxococcaceae bacterium GXIMD 01537]